MQYNMKNLCKCVFVEGKLRAVVSHQANQDQVLAAQDSRKLLMFHDKEQPQQLHWVIFVTKGKTVSFELTTAGHAEVTPKSCLDLWQPQAKTTKKNDRFSAAKFTRFQFPSPEGLKRSWSWCHAANACRHCLASNSWCRR